MPTTAAGMTFRQAQDRLDSLGFRGVKLGLSNITALLERLGNPHRRYPIIHVAGTNGKGSTSAIIANILARAGIRCGLYLSPHLETFRERIQVDGRMIDEAEAASLVTVVNDAARRGGALRPTYFEFLTAMALERFAQAGVEAAVLEVGMGGRLDSTNIVEPLVSVITTIAEDHLEHLGPGLDNIACEKSGVIKPLRPVVCTARHPLAVDAVIQSAEGAGAPLFLLNREFTARRIGMSGSGERFDFFSGHGDMKNIEVGLAGARQIDNASAAAMTALLLRDEGLAADEAAMRAGLASVNLAGRFERAGEDPPVILDAAHNPDAAAALCATIIERFGRGRADIVFGAMRDKDYATMLDNLRPAARSFTCYSPDVPRAADPYDLAAAQTDSSIPTTVVHGGGEVIHMIENAPPDGVVCVTGSFYTLGEIRAALRMSGRRAKASALGS